MLEKIRQRVRFSSNVFDNELSDLISECKADLTLKGVAPLKIADTDPLILSAVSTYVRGYYEEDNAKAERLQRSYESLATHLTLSGEYA